MEKKYFLGKKRKRKRKRKDSQQKKKWQKTLNKQQIGEAASHTLYYAHN